MDTDGGSKQRKREISAIRITQPYCHCHSRERGNPLVYRSDGVWIPAFAGFAGITSIKNRFTDGFKEISLISETFCPAQVISLYRPTQNQLIMKIKPFLSGILALVLLGACKSSTTVVENDLGTFHGNVALVNASGDTLTNYSGATIQIQGTQFQATSAANGDWQIDNVPAGIYNILLTKPGFDTLVIPQYQFSGAGTSFFESTAIQAIPMDSLAFTITNTGSKFSNGFDSHGDSIYGYAGTLTMSGRVFGSDSLEEAHMDVTFGSVANPIMTQSPTCYIVNDSLPSNGMIINYQEPPVPSGTVVTVRSYLYAMPSKVAFKKFQQATTPYPYNVVRTITLP